MQFALTYAPGAYDTRQKMMGRQSAGVGFLRAALAAQVDRIWCYAPSLDQAKVFAGDVKGFASHPPEVRYVPWDEPARLAPVGTLYRPDPGLITGGWNRQSHAGARAYSLCSVTHTLSSHNAMSAIADIVLAPVYAWDALICTSRVARDIVRHLLEARMEDLQARLGAQRFILPQFPVIPLGVHLDDFSFTDTKKAEARTALGLNRSDVAALFAGRLTFHGKGHPLPMFLGLEAAAQRTRRSVSLILFGQFTNPEVEKVFRSEAAQFAPSIRLIVLDGNVSGNREVAWAAADLFTSLSDNVQETFGLTPIEALAAGLPVVVSDWDGYKDTIRHGIDGFRVPTILPPAGCGGIFADRFDAGADDYDLYIGQLSLCTAVDVAAASNAYVQLISDDDLRLRMGQAGRQRAEQQFDWNVIFRRYMSLWDDLAERRRSDPRVPGEERRARRPDRPDPFSLFNTFPTQTLSRETHLRLSVDLPSDAVSSRLHLRSVNYARVLPSIDLMAVILESIRSRGAVQLASILTEIPRSTPGDVERAVVFMLKMGVLDMVSDNVK